jgi:hypothetical protein
MDGVTFLDLGDSAFSNILPIPTLPDSLLKIFVDLDVIIFDDDAFLTCDATAVVNSDCFVTLVITFPIFS